MRSRNIKPGFFENEAIGSLPFEARILFIGLWCISDREGCFEWRPKRIKALIFPYDNIDITCHLMSLHSMSLILKYEVDNVMYGIIPKFKKHQKPHPHEARSVIPYPNEENYVVSNCDWKTEQNQCHDITLNDAECKSDIRNEDIRNDERGVSRKKREPPKIFEKDITDFVINFQNAVLKTHGAKAPKITDSLIQNGSDCIDKLIRIDGFKKEDIFSSIRWAYADSFWSKQVYSLSGLREKAKNGLLKFQNIVNDKDSCFNPKLRDNEPTPFYHKAEAPAGYK